VTADDMTVGETAVDPGPERNDRATRTEELVDQLRSCPDADRQAALREQMVVVNMPVARSIALRFTGRGEPLDDLVQTAHLGLVKAARAFDPERGHDFLSLAVPTVVGELKRHFRDRGWDIRPPRRLQELRSQVERARAELEQELGRSPRTAEVARRIGAGEEEVIECIASADYYRLRSIDVPPAGNEDVDVNRAVGAVDSRFELVEAVMSIRPLLDGLTERDRRILALRYGSEWTQARIGAELGISQMQVSRLIDRTLRRLRAGVDEEAAPS
jgi:RNA polymerase sigma-B factor